MSNIFVSSKLETFFLKYEWSIMITKSVGKNNLACHGTKIHNKVHKCGKISKNNNNHRNVDSHTQTTLV